MIWLCDLDAIDLGNLALVGGKALGLVKLIRGGFPVPPGFCVTSVAFDAIASGQLRESLEAQIIASYRRFGFGKVAVRSSGISEDGVITSFAGQQETMLGIDGDQAVCDAVFRCWKSLFSDRLDSYRQRHRIGEVGTTMAVVVQQMVPAEMAGVVFTRDPLNCDSDEMLVEACWGLGEAVVSGRVTPDRWYLERESGAVRKRQIAVKNLEVTVNGIAAVDPERQRQPCLDDAQLKTLAVLARRVEELLEIPCDIEWANSNGRFWLLQARPITAIGGLDREQVRAEEIAALAAKAESSGTVWSRFNLSEVLPSPTPMTWSIVGRLLSIKGGFGLVYRDLGFDPDPALDEDGIFDLVCGRPYCNLSREPRMYHRRLPLGHSFAALKADPSKAFYPKPALNPTRMDWRFWIRLPVTVPVLIMQTVCAERTRRKLTHTFERRFLEEIVPPFIRQVEAALTEDLTGLDEVNLSARCEIWQQRVLVDFARESLKPTALAMIALGALEQRLAQFLGSERACQAARELIMNIVPGKGADLVKALGELNAGRLTRDVFLTRFGHRGRNEMELAEPRWSEELTPGGKIWPTDQPDPNGSASTQSAASIENAWACITNEAKLVPAIAERIRRDVLTLRSWVSLRETAKHYFMQGYAVIRRFLCELDSRFHLEGGIFYLTPAEIPKLLAGEKLHFLIATRRRRHQLMLELEVPSVLFSDDLESIGRVNPSHGTSELQGIPLSAGVAQGPAVVLNEPTNEHISGPYVLVCPSTDPAWVPLFAGAKALIMETGGVLSHGAIVAREFGLPAVAGIPGVLRTIRTGQLTHVDGKTGIVTLLED